MANIDKRRKVRSLEAKRDALILRRNKAISDLKKVRIEMKEVRRAK